MRNIVALAAGTAILMCSTVVSANEGLYVGASAGYYALDDKRSIIDDSKKIGILGLNIGQRFHNDWALEIMGGVDAFDNDMDTVQLNSFFWMGDAEKNRYNWRPYFVMGTSYYDLSENDLIEDETWQVQGGFGLSKLFKNNWEVRWDARILHKIREGQDGTNDLSLNLGVVRYFNAAPAPAPVVVESAPEPEPYVAAAPEPEPYEPETRSITVRLNVEFEFDKAVVRAIYGDELQAIANAMKVHDDIDLVLEGHTDSRGSDTYNQDLSERRAAAVKAKLVRDYGIPANRISAVGYGESRPIASNETDEGRQRNRRVIGEMSYTEVIPE